MNSETNPSLAAAQTSWANYATVETVWTGNGYSGLIKSDGSRAIVCPSEFIAEGVRKGFQDLWNACRAHARKASK